MDAETKEKFKVMSEEVALAELKEFLKDYRFEELEDKKIKESYPQVVQAMVKGDLTLGENPVYKLSSPVVSEQGNEALSQINFRTRINVSERLKISKGIDKDNPMEFAYKGMAHVMNLKSMAYLDKLSRFDFKVCEQLATLFQ